MQVEERRAHLEKYLQGICQDPGIASSSIFVGFFLNAQKVYVITIIALTTDKSFLQNHCVRKMFKKISTLQTSLIRDFFHERTNK